MMGEADDGGRGGRGQANQSFASLSDGFVFHSEHEKEHGWSDLWFEGPLWLLCEEQTREGPGMESGKPERDCCSRPSETGHWLRLGKWQ